MVKTRIKTSIHQINPYEAYKGADELRIIESSDGMHYNAEIDRQIRVPIANVEDYLRKLKGGRRSSK